MAVGIKTTKNYATLVSNENFSQAFPSFCFESHRNFRFISAANYITAFAIIRETDELGLKSVYFRSNIKGSLDLRIQKKNLAFGNILN